MEDQNAISRLKQGDLNGLEILVNRYQVQAVHAAYLILYDQQLAEDIVQSTFIKVAQHIHQFDDQRPFAPWFFRIILNDARKLAEKQARDVSLNTEVDQSDGQLAKWLTDPVLGPEEQVEQLEMRETILEAIQSLPPGQRSAIVMRYYLNMNMAEMSGATERPLSTIKWWLRDARSRLRRLMSTAQNG